MRASPPPHPVGRPGNLGAVRWIELPSHGDDRGVLTAIEGMRDVPFDIRRVYFVHRIVADRGGHAHLDTHQVVVAISGHCDMMLTDGTDECVHRLDRVTRGLYIPPMLFIRMTAFAPDTVLASFASTHYDASRSLRSWDAYLRAIGR